MTARSEDQTNRPAVTSPWWWEFFFGPVMPVGSPGREDRDGGPIVVPAPGVTPVVGPTGPELGFGPEPDDLDTPAESVSAGLTDDVGAIFAPVVLIILLFFFAITTTASM